MIYREYTPHAALENHFFVSRETVVASQACMFHVKQIRKIQLHTRNSLFHNALQTIATLHPGH